MLSAVLIGPGNVVLETVARPVLTGPGQVVVTNLVSTICGSDVHIVSQGVRPSGAAPGFPGHESVGLVAASSDPLHREGDLVLAVPDLEHAGGCAEDQLLPSAFVLPLPAHTAPETAVLAQQLGTVVYAMKRFWPWSAPGVDAGTAVVLGAGSVGLFFTRLCRLAGFSSVITCDLHEHRLAAARRMVPRSPSRPERPTSSTPCATRRTTAPSWWSRRPERTAPACRPSTASLSAGASGCSACRPARS